MKIKNGFELRVVCGEAIVVAHGLENIDFSKIINLNESAAYLWRAVEGKDFDAPMLAQLLTEEYEVDPETAPVRYNITEAGTIDCGTYPQIATLGALLRHAAATEPVLAPTAYEFVRCGTRRCGE